MPTYESSQGKGIGLGAVVAPVDMWRGNWTVRLAEVTTGTATPAGGGGTLKGTRYVAVVGDFTWEATFPEDTDGFAEALGFAPGTVIPDAYFVHAGGVADHLYQTTVETVERSVDPKTDVPRVRVSGKGGDLSPNVSYGS